MKDERQLASEIRDKLIHQDRLIKEAQAEKVKTFEKVSALQEEISILHDVIDLISKGVIDPAEGPSTADEFIRDPSQVDVIKQALSMGLDHVPAIGVSASVGGEADKAADPLTQYLANLAPRLREI
jgi:hypothetical protein